MCDLYHTTEGSAPTISVDNTGGCQLYLSKDSLGAAITTAKSSEINVLVPGAGAGDDWVMQCQTEEDCSTLAMLLPATEVALLNWDVNLMADVVQQEHINKMNAHNIAMVFAPNMTQIRKMKDLKHKKAHLMEIQVNGGMSQCSWKGS